MGGTSTARRRPGGALVLAVALAVAGAAACGQQQAGGPAVSSSTSSPSGGAAGEPAPPGAVTPTPTGQAPSGSPAEQAPQEQALTVVVDDGSGTSSTWTLTCAPDGTPGGDHPDAASACAALAAATVDPFAPVPRDRMCTQVYGGP